MSIRHKTGLGYEDLQNKVKYVYIFKQSYMPPELLLDFVLVCLLNHRTIRQYHFHFTY